VVTVDSLVRALDLEHVGPDRYRAQNAEAGMPVIFGGQLLAQSVVAALVGHEGKTVKTVHTIFARSGNGDSPVEITVDRMHAGRAFASCTVTIGQAGTVLRPGRHVPGRRGPGRVVRPGRHGPPAPRRDGTVTGADGA
jgi:acyl-CoA thioesterase-2